MGSFAPSPSPAGAATSPFSRLGRDTSYDTDGARGGGRSAGGGGDASGPGTEGGGRSGPDDGDERSAEATPGREQTKLINNVRAVAAPD